MKFLMTYQQNPNNPPPTPAKMGEIGAFAQRQMAKGTLIMTGGLVRPTKGIQVSRQKGEFVVTDGPFAESKELIDGFALIQVASRAEALAMANEFMSIAGDGVGEVLQVFEGGPNPE